MFCVYEIRCKWEEGEAVILKYYIDILLAIQKKSTKIPNWYNDVSGQVWNPDSMKEIEAYDCFTKLHFSDERTVQSP
jgi:hypothetical protein